MTGRCHATLLLLLSRKVCRSLSLSGERGGGPNERLEGPWPGLRPALGVGLGGYTAVVTNQQMRNDS